MNKDIRQQASTEAKGVAFGIAAYGIWGFLTIYWKSLSAVPAVQILAHRILWAFAFTLLLCLLTGRGRDLLGVLRSGRRVFYAVAAGMLISVNWGIYIWAVNQSQIVETSLGYYLNPLVSAALGALVLREKLDRGLIAAYIVAGLGIVVQAVAYGRLPWIALSLATTFALYGLIKKMAALDALTGLALETAAVFPLALGYLLLEQAGGRGSFGNGPAVQTVLLSTAGIVTAIPLLFFSAGVKRLPLSKMGILQYISPTLQLFLGVLVYGEKLDLSRAISFGCVMAALIIFSLSRKAAASSRPR